VSELARVLLDELDDRALEVLAARLAPFLLDRLRPAAPEDRWLASRDAAEYLGLSLASLHRLTAAGAIPFHQNGPACKLWFRLSELDKWRQ
jgi:excisionase family DNA binding protein